MESSILTSTKKFLGLAPDYTPFDQEIIVFSNSAFSSLHELGVASVTGYFIEDDLALWADLELTGIALAKVKTYVYLKVRMLFDPPTTSYLIEAIEKQIQEHEWKLTAFHDISAAATYADSDEVVL